jgi:V/A-type H+/Na+-transporting ATPase subunit I
MRSVEPVRMQRVALVVPAAALRDALVRIADAGVVELDGLDGPGATGAGGSESAAVHPVLAPTAPDVADLAERGATELLAGEAQLARVAESALRRGSVAAWAGWCPVPALPGLVGSLSPVGAAAVPLPPPRGIDPPSLLAENGPVRRSFGPVVGLYGTVPYPDVDPTLPAALAYVLMFGMMFGDAGQGAVLLLAAFALRAGRPRRLVALRAAWPFVAAAGLAGCLFGLLYGEFFGPTGVVPVLWLAPLEEPVRMMAVAVGVGGVLLAAAYVVAIVNRWREGGPQRALYASGGVAGALLFLGIACVALGLSLSLPPLVLAGAAVMPAALVLSAIGFFAASGGGAAGVIQAAVEVVDAVVRTGTNLISFARLAAFGLTHAALGWLVWQATTGLAAVGGLAVVAAGLVFVLGNAVTFVLEGVVAAIQALRLEFYELFSRVFATEGRPFRPWHFPTACAEHAAPTEVS